MFYLLCGLLLAAQLSLPRRFAFLPIVIAACTLGNIELFANLTIIRLLIITGLLRAVTQGHAEVSLRQPLDVLILLLSTIAVASSFAHGSADGNPLTARAGLALNIAGTYFYARAYIKSNDDYGRFVTALPLVLLPLAVLMTMEKRTGVNYHQRFGITQHSGSIRDDTIRATGVFRSPILAGTAGATALPLMLLLWRRRRLLGGVGIAACGAIVYASASSGPFAAAAFGSACFFLWTWRGHLPKIKLLATLVVLGVALVMNRPIWYIMASIDLVGGSTGWHRARLMDQGWKYLDEWWLAGSDYTRHWMATGVSWSNNHVDMTNYYLHLGVIGGIWLTLLIILILFCCFRIVGSILRDPNPTEANKITLWGAGAALASHALSFVSISYFDQMFVLFYILVGSMVGLKKSAIDSTDAHSDVNNRDQQANDTRPLYT